jgi:type IV fimbrial biogenesis protein FimT
MDKLPNLVAPWQRIKIKGFTAIELMVVVAIVAVLAALAGPSFKPLIERWRVRQSVEGLRSALYFAQSEAIKRSGNVVLQKLPNNTNGCTTATGVSDWDCGWIVCDDADGNNKCGASEQVLQRFDTPSGVQVSRSSSSGESISLNRWGLVNGTWPGFAIVPFDKSTADPAARGLCMSSAGRIRIIRPENIPCS